MNVFVVILHYGSIELTKKCINSLSKNDNNSKKIVLVNNDKNITISPSVFHLSRKKLKVINNKKNLGFSAGVNVGIKYALGENVDAVLLLNNDAMLKEPLLKKLIAVSSSDESIGIASPAIQFSRNGKQVFDIGGKVNKFFWRTSHEEVYSLKNLYTQEVDYVTGAAMFIKREVFTKVGFLDEHFFLYYEDVDFCLRARRQGFRIIVEPRLKIYHSLSKTIGKVSSLAIYHQTRSALIFGRKHIQYPLNKFFHIAFLIFQAIFITFKHPSVGIPAFKAFLNLPLE